MSLLHKWKITWGRVFQVHLLCVPLELTLDTELGLECTERGLSVGKWWLTAPREQWATLKFILGPFSFPGVPELAAAKHTSTLVLPLCSGKGGEGGLDALHQAEAAAWVLGSALRITEGRGNLGAGKPFSSTRSQARLLPSTSHSHGYREMR